MDRIKPKKMKTFSMTVRDSIKLFTTAKHKKRADQALPTSFDEGQQLMPPTLKTVTAKDEEEWYIKSLPSDWQPNLKPSKVIARLNQKKETQHKEVVEDMEAKIFQVNTRLEERLRQITMIYKEALIRNSKDIEEVLKPIRVERKGKLQFTQGYFNELIEKVSNTNSITNTKLYQMMDAISDLETERTNEFKKILKDACEKLNAISYQLPFELQEFLEKKIQDINEITMNNVRCYAELETHLQLHLKNQLRLQLEEIQSAESHWIDFMNASALQELNETKLLNISCSQVLLESFKEEEKQLLEKSIQAQIAEPHGIPLEAICRWLQEVDAIAFNLDDFEKELLHAFETSIADLFRHYFTDVEKLAEKIASLSRIEFNQAKGDLHEPLLLHKATKYNLKIQNIQNSWNTAQEELLGHLQETFAFLCKVSDIKENHQSRLHDIETLVFKDLQRLEKQNDGLVRAEEVKLNIALDNLRQESELENLGVLMRQIQTILTNVEKVYNSNYEKEYKLLEKASDLVEKESEVLMVELWQFLSAYAEFAPTDTSNEALSIISDKEDEENEEGLLSSQIEMCYGQIEKLKSWRKELYQAIDYYYGKCQKHNFDWANAFIENHRKDLKEVLTNKLTFLCETKYDRIKANIYDLRVAEIENHEEMLQRHKAGFQKQMDIVSAVFPKYAPKYDAVISTYDEDVAKLTIKIVAVKNPETIKTAQASLRIFTENCKKNLEAIDQEYEKEYLSEKNRISLANANYIKALLMFSEEGNFNWQEARTTCAEIAKLEKNAKKKITSPVKASKSKLERSCQEVQAKHEELQTLMNHHVEELEFSNKCKTSLEDLRAALIQETFSMKFKRNQLMASVANAREVQAKHLGAPNCVQVVVQLTKSTIEKFQEYLGVIARPELKNYGNYVAEAFLKTGSKSSASFDSKKSSSSLSVSKNLLFDIEPEVEPNFISKVQRLIYSSYERVHTFGTDFYSKRTHATFRRKELLHPSFEDYVVEMLPKHIYFYLQCEMMWLKETHDFMEMVEDFSCYLRDYRRRFVREYANNCTCNLQRFLKDTSAKVDGQVQEMTDDFIKIHRKLKPLHGYPGNKSLLADLTLEIDEFFQSSTEKTEPYFESFTADLESRSEFFKEKIAELDCELEVVEQAFFGVKTVLVQYEATLNYLKSILALRYDASSTEDVEDVDLKTKLLRQLELLKANLSLPLDYVSKVDSMESSIADEDSISGPNKELGCLIQKYNEEMQVIFAEINNMKEKDKNVLQQWKDMWALDLVKVAQLYDVKYNLPSLKAEK